MRTAILTDTNSGIMVEEGMAQNIFVIPMPVIIDDACYFEGADLTHADLYDAMRQNKAISSSQPSPGVVLEMWEDIFSRGYEEIVYIPMSSGLSCSCGNAIQLAEEYDGRVQVVDNHRIPVTLKQSVLEAKAFADRGDSAAQIKGKLEASAYESSIYVTVDTLEYLKKGGRITPMAATLGTVLNIKPILTIQGEKLDAYAKGRGMKQCEQRMIEAVKKDYETRFAAYTKDKIRIDVAGTFVEEGKAEEWRSAVQEAFPEIAVSYIPLSCSIACHLGTNAAGIGICGVQS